MAHCRGGSAPSWSLRTVVAPPRCGPRRCVAPHQSGPPFREDGEGRGGEGAADRKGRGGASSSEGRGREGEAASTFEGRGGDGQVWLRWWEWELGFSDEFLYILELVVGCPARPPRTRPAPLPAGGRAPPCAPRAPPRRPPRPARPTPRPAPATAARSGQRPAPATAACPAPRPPLPAPRPGQRAAPPWPETPALPRALQPEKAAGGSRATVSGFEPDSTRGAFSTGAFSTGRVARCPSSTAGVYGGPLPQAGWPPLPRPPPGGTTQPQQGDPVWDQWADSHSAHQGEP
ncbi:basic proline-rich protein [Sorghum bicolor]|uniref:basic proline-rich protein n=1 Tax=Sorghum bicolor TaxID=4558 RepID=UPI000B426346|nr:basic proline-rich protein [Sorghum bicolor]|eukprot:XP_021306624.1 basic proline-rich protein [Sorghum bicolor]